MESLEREARRGEPGAIGPGGASDPALDREATDGDDRPLVCARCRLPITSEAERIDIDGLHEHTQINPHGVVWSFACFARAPGCAAVGRPSREFTWFAGHAWQIASCGGCAWHLGWRFISEARAFHGLIVGRVVPASGDGGPGFS